MFRRATNSSLGRATRVAPSSSGLIHGSCNNGWFNCASSSFSSASSVRMMMMSSGTNGSKNDNEDEDSNKMRSSWWWTRRAKFCGAAAVFTALATTTVVACKPKDTPDYLMPYYLRDSRSRFNHYATIKDKETGRKYMKPEDFLLSILASPAKEMRDSVGAADDINALFHVVDRNNDGRISFREYSLLMVLLATSIDDFKLGFKMFDIDGHGSLSPQQFQDMLHSFGDANSRPKMRGQLMLKLFGAPVPGKEITTYKQRCTFDLFRKCVEDIQMEITKAEFRQFDPKRQGYITSEHFGKLISASMLGSHLPFFIVDNIRKMKANSTTVPFETWVSFTRIMKNADAIGEAVQMYTSADLPLRKEDLNRAIGATGLPILADSEVDLVFALFDKDGDGTLEYEEFISVMSNKGSFHCRKREERDRQSLYSRAFTCTLDALEP